MSLEVLKSLNLVWQMAYIFQNLLKYDPVGVDSLYGLPFLPFFL